MSKLERFGSDLKAAALPYTLVTAAEAVHQVAVTHDIRTGLFYLGASVLAAVSAVGGEIFRAGESQKLDEIDAAYETDIRFAFIRSRQREDRLIRHLAREAGSQIQVKEILILESHPAPSPCIVILKENDS